MMVGWRYAIVIGLLAGFALVGCRINVKPEARVPVHHLQSKSASLAIDVAGLWYVISEQNAALTDFVIIEHADRRHAFYAAGVGKRTAQLLPLTPVRSDWFEAAHRDGAKIEFVTSLDGVSLSAAVGIWSGDSASPIVWPAAAPRGKQAALVLPMRAPAAGSSLSAVARGIVSFEGTTITEASEGLLAANGPYLILPDGVLRERVLRVASLGKSQWAFDQSEPWLLGSNHPTVSLEPSELNEFALVPLGRTLGADVLVAEVEGRWIVTLSDPADGRIGRFYRMEAALAQVPLSFGAQTSSADLIKAARALAALRDGHPLVAAFLLRDQKFEVHGNRHAARWRRLELFASAGFGAWMRAELLTSAEGIDADLAIYIARSFAFEANWPAVEHYATNAMELFGTWPAPAGALGRARAELLLARAFAERADMAQAARHARSASNTYGEAGDTLMAATALARQAGFSFELGGVAESIDAGLQARNLYQAGGSLYFAAISELRLARLLLEAERTRDALELIASAMAKLAQLDEPVATNRAEILALVARQQAQPGFDPSGGLLEAFGQAGELGDPVGALFAASILVKIGKAYGNEDVYRYGLAIVNGLSMVDEMHLRRDARSALASVCTRGLPVATSREHGDPAQLRRACETTRDYLAADPKVVAIWLGQGYRHLQMEQFDRADLVVAELRAMLTPDFIEVRGGRAAEILLLEAALIRAQTEAGDRSPGAVDEDVLVEGPSAEQRVVEAFAILRQSIDPARAAQHLFDLSQQFSARGIDWLAVLLARASVQAAQNARQSQLEQEHLLYLAGLLNEAGRWQDLVELQAPQSGPQQSRIELYQSDAAARLGDTARAKMLRKGAFERLGGRAEIEQMGLLQLAARHDLARNDAAAAEQALSQAFAIEQGLPASLVTSQQARILVARQRGLRGQWHQRHGRQAQADEDFEEAMAILAEFPTSVAPSVRIEVLEAQGAAARSSERLADVLLHLTLLRTQIDVFRAPDVAREATRALIGLALAGGDITAADRHMHELFEVGFAPYASREATLCLRSKVAFYGGQLSRALPLLRRCAALASVERTRSEATMLVALIEPNQPSQRAALARAFSQSLGGAEPRESLRLAYFTQIAGPQRPYDGAAHRRLEQRLERAGSSARSSEVSELVSYLLETGRADDAEVALDAHSAVFHRPGEESAGELMRLRMATLIYQLRPVEAKMFIERALLEADEIAPTTLAAIAYQQAQNFVLLGQWHEASRAVVRCEEHAAQAKDRRIQADVKSLAERFSL
ncbi:MAG: hypothetical protein H0U74_15785 [Bradymonadaceae bacterium]|nr:hypothetical protein [Lujinxingiaceae bacterium]